MIVDLKIALVKAHIPNVNCPYAYYNRENPVSNCVDISCNKCKKIFFNGMRKEFEAEVEKY